MLIKKIVMIDKSNKNLHETHWDKFINACLHWRGSSQELKLHNF